MTFLENHLLSLADNSYEISSLIFSEKLKKNENAVC